MSAGPFPFREGCDDVPTVLSVLQQNTMVGRPLDITGESDPIDGDTTPIFVSRQSLFEDGMSELLAEDPPPVLNTPLEVTFYGERAQDFGGPRREFILAMLQEIKERLLLEEDNEKGYKLRYSLAAVNHRHFYGAGVVFGAFD